MENTAKAKNLSAELVNWLKGNMEQAERYVRYCEATCVHKQNPRVYDKYLACLALMEGWVDRTTQFMEQFD